MVALPCAVHAVILERNKLVGRKVARLFLAAGFTAEAIDDPMLLAIGSGEDTLLCADAFDGDLVVEQLRSKPGLRGVLWTAEPLRRSLRHMIESMAIDHVLGRRDFDTPPRAWEVTMVARRFLAPVTPPLAAYLDWGFSALELDIRTSADRDDAVRRIQELVGALQAPRRVGEMFGELAHELMMNAMYDAPIDGHGRPKFARDRKADVRLADGERPIVRAATDGTKLVLQVRDPFGRLERVHVVDGLARGLANGEIDRSGGGAGLGFLVCHNASSGLFFDVGRGRYTEVTAIFELDMNLRELRTQAKSLHFWSA
jgi:hypothetical protein